MPGIRKSRRDMDPDELERERARQARARRLRGYGTPLHVTPTELEAARDIIAAAHQRGMSYPAMEAQLGVGRQLISDVHRGRKTTIQRVNYEAIIKLEFVPTPQDSVRHGARLNATGSIRRIDALRAKGFTKDFLASYVGVQHQNLPPGVGGSKWIYPAMATKIREMYDKLRDADPRDFCGENGVRRAEQRAQRLGLVLPDYWDDDTIDDPDGIPEYTGACGSEEGWMNHHLFDIPMCQPCADAVPGNPSLGTVQARYRWDDTEVRKVMEKRGFNINSLEVAMGLTKGIANRWFNAGEHNPSWKSGLKVAAFLDLSWTDIYKKEQS